MDKIAALFDTNNGFPAELSNSWKIWGHHNALYTQGFGADPTVMVYDDRVYLFASNDSLLFDVDGNVVQLAYGPGIQGLRAVSSADMVNWTDHGVINVGGTESTNPLFPTNQPLASFPTVSWAPSAAWKMIGGKPQFFVYYANSGNGIGVITADSPAGPWRSPLNKLLIDRSTPNCSNVIWLFDPGVFIDDDGSAFLFFGGGTQGAPSMDNTGQARRVRLNDDMVSIAGVPQTWHVPYLFEAQEMTKINGKYYFSYTVNWNAGWNRFGLKSAEIAYMTGEQGPMGEFSDPCGLMPFAGTQLASADENNHHCIFQFRGNTYIAYHTSKVAEAMGVAGFHYRSPCIDKVTVNPDGTLNPVTMTRKGVEQQGYLNPYIRNEAETIGIMGGVYTRPESGASNGMVVTSIDSGDWLGVYGVDFGNAGARQFTARVRMPETADYGAIELRLDPEGAGVTGDNGNLNGANTARIKGGKIIGRIWIKAEKGHEGEYATVTAVLDTTVTGVHDLVFVFYSSLGVNPETVNPDSRHKNGFEFDTWQFFG